MGGTKFPSISFCLYLVALDIIVLAMRGVRNTIVAALCSSWSLQNISNRDRADSYEPGRSMSVNAH